MKNNTIFIISRSVLLRMRNASDKSCKKIKTRILCLINVLNPCHFLRQCVKILWSRIGRVGQCCACALHAGWLILKTHTHTHTHTHTRKSNTYCFSSAKFVARTLLGVTLYAHCLSFSCLFSSHFFLSCLTFVSFCLNFICIYFFVLISSVPLYFPSSGFSHQVSLCEYQYLGGVFRVQHLYQITRHNSKDHNMGVHRNENFKSELRYAIKAP